MPPSVSIMHEVEVGALTELIALYQANQAQVESWIGSGESVVESQVAALVKQIPTVKGALALIAGPLEAAAEAAINNYVEQLVAKYTPAQVYTLVLALLQHLLVTAQASA